MIRPEQLALLEERLGRNCGSLIVPVTQSASSVVPALPFHVRKEQQELLAESMKRRFIAKAIRVLPQLAPSWGGKSEMEKVVVVEEMIAFAASYEIYQEVNIIKLLSWREELQFHIPLIPELGFILGRKQLGEGYRVERFYEALVSAPLRPVSLEEDF